MACKRSAVRSRLAPPNLHPASIWQVLYQRCGAIAQLGERLHGMQEVSGSIPLSSTKFPLPYSIYQIHHTIFNELHACLVDA